MSALMIFSIPWSWKIERKLRTSWRQQFPLKCSHRFVHELCDELYTFIAKKDHVRTNQRWIHTYSMHTFCQALAIFPFSMGRNPLASMESMDVRMFISPTCVLSTQGGHFMISSMWGHIVWNTCALSKTRFIYLISTLMAGWINRSCEM